MVAVSIAHSFACSESQVLTVGALHLADSAALRTAASVWHDELAVLLKPLLVVNIGGPTSKISHFLGAFCLNFIVLLLINARVVYIQKYREYLVVVTCFRIAADALL